MKTKSFQKTLIFLLFLMLYINCSERNNENNNENFCNIQRTYYKDIDDKIGTLVYLEDKKKYAIKHYPNEPTIDEVNFYFLCEKPDNININDSIKFRIKLYKFNNNENYNPTVMGMEFYFATIKNIIKL